jgi:hypothetical protein
MAELLELLEVLSTPSYKANYLKSKATSTCIRCGRLANKFRDSSARLEYKVSALCQKCQDDCYRGKKPRP